ncbi:MAG: hypothetical protein HOW97_29705 [Catenulispora sp.]|nr:hypothetical protein [Catenulispora sp.]
MPSPTEEDDDEDDEDEGVVVVLVGLLVVGSLVEELDREIGLCADPGIGLEESDVGVGALGCGVVAELDGAVVPGAEELGAFRSARCKSRFASVACALRAASAPAAAAAPTALPSWAAASVLFRRAS